MLSDDERFALREIERRLRWSNPELVRLFGGAEPEPPAIQRQRARARVMVAAAALTALTLLGPRMLNEAEVRTHRRRPPPCTAPVDRAGAGADPSPGGASATAPGAVAELFREPTTLVAIPPFRTD